MAENYIVPLSYKMTMYGRDQQKQEWYNDNLIVIKAWYRTHGDEIAKECKRRNILHSYSTTDFNRIEIVYGEIVYKPRYMVYIKETGPKVQELVDWTILKFNAEDRLNTDEGFKKWNVWIQIQDEEK